MATGGLSPQRDTCFSLLELRNEDATNATPKKYGRGCVEEDTYTTPQNQQNGTEATGKVETDSTDTTHSSCLGPLSSDVSCILSYPTIQHAIQ
jgi:hypothetical protein